MHFVDEPGNLSSVYNIISMGRKAYSILQTDGLQANFLEHSRFVSWGPPGILTYS